MSRPEAGVRNAKARAGLTLHVARAQAGDRQALDRILRDHQEPLYRHIRTIMKDRDLAYDALQNSLLLIARRLGGLRDPRLFKAWAYRIATRESCYFAHEPMSVLGRKWTQAAHSRRNTGRARPIWHANCNVLRSARNNGERGGMRLLPLMASFASPGLAQCLKSNEVLSSIVVRPLAAPAPRSRPAEPESS